MVERVSLRTFTRIGFAARGLLYIIIGWLIFRTGRSEDLEGALAYVAEGGGELLMMAVTAGFLAYGFWRLSDAMLNVENHPDDGKGKRERLGAAGSGIVYLLLAWQSIRLIRGYATAAGDPAQDNARTALGLPGGEVMLAAAGIILFLVGGYQLIKAAKAGFLKHLEPAVAAQPWAKWMGRLGYGARGVIFIITGGFLVKSGMEAEAQEAGGIESALTWLDSPWDLMAAFGLVAFGLYSLVEARFRVLHHVPVEELAHDAAARMP